MQQVISAAEERSSLLIVIECLHSLHNVFGVNPIAFVHSLLGFHFGFSLLVASPKGSTIDNEIEDLTDLADHILDLHDLQTGVADDIDGIITVSKKQGRWDLAQTPRRYHLTESSFVVYA